MRRPCQRLAQVDNRVQFHVFTNAARINLVANRLQLAILIDEAVVRPPSTPDFRAVRGLDEPVRRSSSATVAVGSGPAATPAAHSMGGFFISER